MYILFIFILPFDINKSLLLLIGFFTGLSVDIFSNTFGIHAAATSLLAFIRPTLLSLISTREAYEAGSYPSINLYGFTWFIKYIAIGTLIHHTALFILEIFNFEIFHITLGKIFTNLITSMSLMLFYYIISLKHTKQRR